MLSAAERRSAADTRSTQDQNRAAANRALALVVGLSSFQSKRRFGCRDRGAAARGVLVQAALPWESVIPSGSCSGTEPHVRDAGQPWRKVPDEEVR